MLNSSTETFAGQYLYSEVSESQLFWKRKLSQSFPMGIFLWKETGKKLSQSTRKSEVNLGSFGVIQSLCEKLEQVMHAATGRNGSQIRPMGNHGTDQIVSEKRLTTIPLPQLRMSAFSVFLSNYVSYSFAPSAGSATAGNVFYTYYNYNTNKK